jgi:hypothetical protein
MNQYTITDLNEFTDGVRKIVFGAFGKPADALNKTSAALLSQLSPEEEAELETVLSHNEAISIVKSMIKKQTHNKTRQIRYVVDDKIFNDIVEALNSRIVSNILSNLVQKGVIESAFDDEIGDFVFWASENTDLDNDDDHNQKSKTS